jgi:hypothetical protein
MGSGPRRIGIHFEGGPKPATLSRMNSAGHPRMRVLVEAAGIQFRSP